jgi:stress response protein YsnF
MTSGITSDYAARRTVTAFFDNRRDAEEAVSRLEAAGISHDSVRLIPGNERDTDAAASPDVRSLGDASTGFWDSLRDLFLPDEDRYTYAEGLRRGGYLVSVNASDAEYERVLDILDDEGTIDIDERAASWRAEGWSGTSSAAVRPGGTVDLTAGTSGTTATTGSGLATGSLDTSPDRTGPGVGSLDTSPDRAARGEEVIPVAEERLQVRKRDADHGRVRVRSYVVETPVSEQVSLREERVEIKRRPVDRDIGSTDDAFRERTIEMEERSEEAVVSKEARIKEELVVKKDVEQRTETVSDTVRSTKVEVEDERGNKVGGTGTDDRTP